MKNRGKFFKRLREGIFGKDSADRKTEIPAISLRPTRAEKPRRPKSVRSSDDGRNPHIIQIGLDFGTSFLKCVCRDVVKGKAWVHLPEFAKGEELPFLIPSAVIFKRGKLQRFPDSSHQYADSALYHLKLALERIARREFQAPVLENYKKTFDDLNESELARTIQAVAIYLLGSTLADVRSSLLRRPQFRSFGEHKQDYIAINMAIPVAHAENSRVAGLFERVLQTAWVLAPKLKGYPEIGMAELFDLISAHHTDAADFDVAQACFVYPEVSANVQGFVRSRSSSPGVYLFSDTGAGTVDQSIFEFIRHDPSHGVRYFPGRAHGKMHRKIKEWVNSGEDYLRYFSAAVLPIGSSQIERLAAAAGSGMITSKSLERWRLLKEAGSSAPELVRAAATISKDLSDGTASTLLRAKRKVYSPKKLYDIRLVFGGGGHCDNPYARGVMSAFPRKPDVVGVPHPKDLDLGSGNKRWLPRLSVAYGLSFQKADLAKFSCPTDLPDVAHSRSYA